MSDNPYKTPSAEIPSDTPQPIHLRPNRLPLRFRWPATFVVLLVGVVWLLAVDYFWQFIGPLMDSPRPEIPVIDYL